MPEPGLRLRCEDEARDALLAAARDLAAAGIPGSASLSLRWARSAAAGMLTVRAPIAAASTADVVAWVPLDARLDRPGMASPELPADWELHRELLGRRSRLEAVVRCRPVFCMTLACSPRFGATGIPSFHADAAAAAAARIRCAQPAGQDAAALAVRVDEALGERAACLLAGEGLVAVGPTLDAAVMTVANVETLAQVAWRLREAQHREPDGVAA
jgi:L-fuculose-phosphate aldolase